MFCTNCGNSIDETAKFCIHCGTPTDNQPSDSSAAQVNPESANTIVGEQSSISSKKNRKFIPIIVGAMTLILIVGGITAYFLYQNYIVKQADNVMAYLDDKEYDQALDLYNKYSGKKESFDKKVSTGFTDIVEAIKEDYMSESIDYDSAIDQLQSLEDFKIIGHGWVTYDAAQWINKINASRESYHEGRAYYELGDYEGALEKYGLVLMDDSKYYELAVNEINSILEEEANRQKEAQKQEEINEMREQSLAQAEELANEYDYEAAIIAIENGLDYIPDDPELIERLSVYTELYDLSIRVPAFDTSLYEYTYTEQGIDIMTVTMEMPVLMGDSLGYESINQIFEYAKEYYINDNNMMVEDAKLYINDEYFIPYSFGMSYSVQYNNNGILCILLDGYVYTGGAHGYPLREAFIFDLASGTLRSLSALISVDDQEFASYIRDEFQRMYNEAPDEYWPDSLDVVNNASINIDDMNYFITEDSVCIYYFPYDLASYARGFVEIIIPYEGNERIFEFLK